MDFVNQYLKSFRFCKIVPRIIWIFVSFCLVTLVIGLTTLLLTGVSNFTFDINGKPTRCCALVIILFFPFTICADDLSEMACSISFNFSRLKLWQFFDIYFWSGATVVKRFLKWILSATFLKNKQRWRAEIFRDDRRYVCLVQQCHTCKNVRRQYRLSPEGNKKIDFFNFCHF